MWREEKLRGEIERNIRKELEAKYTAEQKARILEEEAAEREKHKLETQQEKDLRMADYQQKKEELLLKTANYRETTKAYKDSIRIAQVGEVAYKKQVSLESTTAVKEERKLTREQQLAKEAQVRDSVKIVQAAEKEKQSLAEYKTFNALTQQTFACVTDAEAALTHLQKKLTVVALHDPRIVEVAGFKGKGRPRKGRKPDTISYRIEAGVASVLEARQHKIQQKSGFILASNQLDETQLSDEALLDHEP